MLCIQLWSIMGESPHVQKLEAPFKRSIRGLFRSTQQFIPHQDMTLVPCTNYCERFKFQTELDSVIQSSRMKVSKKPVKQTEICFFRVVAAMGLWQLNHIELIKQQKWTGDSNYHAVPRESILKRKRDCSVYSVCEVTFI